MSVANEGAAGRSGRSGQPVTGTRWTRVSISRVICSEPRRPVRTATGSSARFHVAAHLPELLHRIPVHVTATHRKVESGLGRVIARQLTGAEQVRGASLGLPRRVSQPVGSARDRHFQRLPAPNINGDLVLPSRRVDQLKLVVRTRRRVDPEQGFGAPDRPVLHQGRGGTCDLGRGLRCNGGAPGRTRDLAEQLGPADHGGKQNHDPKKPAHEMRSALFWSQTCFCETERFGTPFGCK